MSGIIKQLTEKLSGWLDNLILMAPNLVVAIVIIVLAAVVSKILANIVERLLKRVSQHTALTELAGKLVRFAGIVVGVLIALNILHLDEAATTFLAGAGIVGIAIGFAFQDMSANFISGIAMAIKRPLAIGDLIEVSGFLGKVEAIELRTTLMVTLDGRLVRIPNKDIFQQPIINLSRHSSRRVDVVVGVSYDDDLEKAKQLAAEAVESIKRESEKAVEVFYSGFGASSIDMVIRFWVSYEKHTDYLSAKSQAIILIKKAFDDAGISIPFPIRTLEFGGDLKPLTSVVTKTLQST